MRVLLSEITSEQRDHICNGCGPGGWKKHTWRWTLAHLFTRGLSDACDQHDLDYWVGGAEEDRFAADVRLQTAIMAKAAGHGGLVRAMLEFESKFLFDLVRRYGKDHFHYGVQRKP